MTRWNERLAVPPRQRSNALNPALPLKSEQLEDPAVVPSAVVRPRSLSIQFCGNATGPWSSPTAAPTIAVWQPGLSESVAPLGIGGTVRGTRRLSAAHPRVDPRSLAVWLLVDLGFATAEGWQVNREAGAAVACPDAGRPDSNHAPRAS
jgi:hypothetical protein